MLKNQKKVSSKNGIECYKTEKMLEKSKHFGKRQNMRKI